jgi:hypothetical protein
MRCVAILTGAMLLSPFAASFGQNAPANTSRIVGIVAPVRVSVNVTSRQPTDIRVTLEPSINIKDPAVVTARQYYALEHR